jgi:peptidoglycan/LPS O-acetylase OafA/YrhL
LDGWRTIALALVLLCHTAAGLFERTAYFATSVPRYGDFALNMFFGLSGLLICKLFFEEFDRNGSINLPGFYVRRMCRILLPCAFFTGMVTWLGLIRTKWELVSCLFFFRNFLPVSLGGHYTAHLWSLAIEEHFYLVLPGLLLLFGIRRAPQVLVLGALLCEVWRTVDLHFHVLTGWLAEVPPGARTDLRFDAFLWGCVAAFLLHHSSSAAWLKTWYTQQAWFGVAVLCVLCVEYQPHLVETWTAMLIPLLLLGPLQHPRWLVSRFLELTPMRYVGRVSYSFYLWQQVFLVPKWEPAVPLLHQFQKFPMNLVAILITSLAGYYLVERPFTRLGQILSKRITAATRQGTATPEKTPLRDTVDGKIPVANANYVA